MTVVVDYEIGPANVEIAPSAPAAVFFESDSGLADVTLTKSDPVEVIVTVAEQGPPGPKGDIGPPGPPGGNYHVHDQSAPSDLWTVNHNLGFRPSVELIDVGGNEFNARVLHVTNNHFLVYLNIATAGQARCV